MLIPRIFVSSTFLDLVQIRANAHSLITEMGYEPVAFEYRGVTFFNNLTIDESCFNAIKDCHMFLLIIGKRYGSPVSFSSIDTSDGSLCQLYESITKAEYSVARNNGIPTFIFVQKEVKSEYYSYLANKDNPTVKYAHVDNIGIFHLIEEIHKQKTGNYLYSYETFENIAIELKAQWAGLFADFLSNKVNNIRLENLALQIEELKNVNRELQNFAKELLQTKKQEGESALQSQLEQMHKNKLARFFKEEFIRYISARFQPTISEHEFFKSFENAKHLQSFLLALNADPGETQQLLKFEGAEKEFQKCKNKYFEE